MTSPISRNRMNLPLSASSHSPVAEPLRGMIADLFEAHQEGEHQPAALNAVDLLELLRQIIHHLLVQCGLLAGSRQNVFTSVLSGRSEMMLLSVFSRRRM